MTCEMACANVRKSRRRKRKKRKSEKVKRKKKKVSSHLWKRKEL